MGEAPGQVPFAAHVELLDQFLVQRDRIIERIQELLNAQRQPAALLQDGPLLSRRFEDCFFRLNSASSEQSLLRGQLKDAHWKAGFQPRDMPGMFNDLVDPAQMMIRAFNLWQQTRWPGRNGRVRYAHTLFNLYVIRSLELLSMRLWDARDERAGERLAQIQRLLDRLWQTTPADEPVLVRDARWLFPLAQSPTTYELTGYFDVAERIASLSPDDRLEVNRASVVLAGGHLRSQLRHYIQKNGVSLDENGLVLSARSTNALDVAVTIQSLVPVLQAYGQALAEGDPNRRLLLAGAICQGISPDPELFVNRVDLLGPYSMIEQLFITMNGSGGEYTSMGLRHVQLVDEYTRLIGPLARPLLEDAPQFRPAAGAYSPYGVIYGHASNLLEHMALKTLQPDSITHFSLEDVFADAEASAEKLAWVSGWRQLPHIKPDVQRLFDYPQQFAQEIFERLERALQRHAAEGGVAAEPTGRLFIVTEGDPEAEAKAANVPELPLQYIGASDPQVVAAHKAQAIDPAQLLHDRQEGTFLVSFQTPGGWVALSKDMLTDVLGAGRDAKLSGLPVSAAEVLKLMCPALLA